MLRWQREMPWPGNLKQLQQLLTILTGLAQPSTDRKPAKSRGKGKKGES